MAVSRIDEAGLNVTQYGNRNLIINGAMQVAQRSTSSVTVSEATNEGYSTVDRWYLNFNSAISGAMTMEQSSDAPDGFATSVKLKTSTTNSSPTGNDYVALQQRIEAQNLQALAYGTSSAKDMTLSWYMKTETFTDPISVNFYTDDGTIEYYTVSITPTTSWAKYTVTIPGSTSATINNDTGRGMTMMFVLTGDTTSSIAAGSDSTAWSTARSDFRNDIGNILSSTSNAIYITGVQLEVGDTATGFEHRSYGDEFQRCCRYYQRLNGGTGAQYQRFGSGLCNSTTNCFAEVTLITPMRTVPTVDTTGTASNYAINHSSGTVSALTSVPSIEATADNPLHTVILNSGTSSLTGGNYGVLIANNSTSAYLGFDAEL